MKILVVNDQFERGGAGRVAAIQCNGLKKRGYEVVLVTDSLHWSETYHVEDTIPKKRITVKTIKPGFINKLKKWIICSLEIRKYIKEENPDVIIAIQSMMFLCAYLGNLGLRIPIIAADHTSFSRRIDPIIDYVRYHLYGKAEGLSILTEKDASLLGSKFPRKRVIYNPLSFPLIDKPSSNKKKNILCAGRLEDWKIKGFDIIIKIWADICTEFDDWTLEIAGSGTESSVQYIKSLLNDLGVSHRVRLLGQVNDMRSLYANSSIFALASRIEGFPMVLMEAMSQGCACVAFSIGGASSEMMEENSGIIVNDDDCEGFKNSLKDVIKNDILREELSLNAIRSVGKFSIDQFIDSWADYIDETQKKSR